MAVGVAAASAGFPLAVIAMASPMEPRVDIPDHSSAEASFVPLTPGEALAKLFLDNADRGANAANDDLVAALRERARAIQALTELYDEP